MQIFAQVRSDEQMFDNVSTIVEVRHVLFVKMSGRVD
jgi:hypothetical protein